MGDALLCIDEVLRLSPHTTELFCAMAKLMADMGNQDEAMWNYQRVIGDYPKAADAHFGLATIAQTAGSHADAPTHYKRILALCPDDAMAIYGLACCRRLFFGIGQGRCLR